MFPKRTAPLDVCFRHQPDRCFTFINKRPVISKDIEKVCLIICLLLFAILIFHHLLKGDEKPVRICSGF